MDVDKFFEKYYIDSWDELEELPWRFRDASAHYYHKKTDKVYTRFVCSSKEGLWYITPFSEKLRFRYTDPDGYKKQQEDEAQRDREKQRKFADYEKQFKDGMDVIKKHEVGKVVVTDKSFIDDVIDSKNYCISFNRVTQQHVHYCEFYKIVDKMAEEGITDVSYPDTVQTYPTKSLRHFEFCWDFKTLGGQDLYVEFNGVRTQLHPNAVLPTAFATFTNIDLVDEKGNKLDGVTYKGLSLVRTGMDTRMYQYLRNKKLLSPNGKGQLVACDGWILNSNEKTSNINSDA